MLKLHHLRNLSAIGRTSSIRAAAKSLGLAQPAVSKSLREMEMFLGVTLARRNAQGVALTPAGERFLSRANRLLADLERAVDEARQLDGQTSGALHIGLSPALQGRLPISVLPRFRQRWPSITVRFTESFLEAAERALLNGDMDLYVGPRWATTLNAGLSARGVGELQRGVVARTGHASDRESRLDQLVGVRWLDAGLHEGAAEELRSLFERENLPVPQVVASASSAAAISSILLASDLVALLPHPFTSWSGDKGLVKLPLKLDVPAIKIWLVQRTALPLTPAGDHFAELVQAAFTES